MTRDNMASYNEVLGVLDALPIIVRERRRREGLSLREAAKLSGVSAATLMRLEKGQADINLANVKTLLLWVSK